MVFVFPKRDEIYTINANGGGASSKSGNYDVDLLE